VIEIVPAVPADAGELLTVQRAAYLSEAQLHGDLYLPPLTETVDEIRTAMARERVLTAREGTRMIGSVRLRMDGDTGHVGRLAVAPDLQGRGIGSRLVRAAEETAPGAARFELFTGPRSLQNIALYERLGYRRIATPAGREPLVFLEKRGE
jgi:ribosomal protein S18 acetylase RimI-like enzyme